LETQKDVNNKFIWNVLKALSEVSDSSVGMLLENLKLRVDLVELVSQSASNHFSQYLIK
jgi:hypothetical protein